MCAKKTKNGLENDAYALVANATRLRMLVDIAKVIKPIGRVTKDDRRELLVMLFSLMDKSTKSMKDHTNA